MNEKPKLSLVMAGKLAVWEQEGGYASPSITIAGEDLGGALEELIQRENLTMDAGYEGRLSGYWVLSLARVSEDDPEWAKADAERALSTPVSGQP